MSQYQIFRKLTLMSAVAVLTACAGTGPGNEDRVSQRTTTTVMTDTPAPVGDRDQLAKLVSEVAHAENSAEQVSAGQSSDASLTEVAVTGRQVNGSTYKRDRRANVVANALSCCPAAPTEPPDNEQYGQYEENGQRLTSANPVSTFSIDVDTGAYSNVRRILNEGRMPPHDAVRVEEMINYFSYDYPTPRNRRVPFNVMTELAVTPWNPDTLLMQVGLKGFEVPDSQRPPANLVFLVDVSGSMRSPDKLPLLVDALKMLTRQLDERDTIAIAGYAGGAGLVLEPTSGARKEVIIDALNNLTASGRTNGAAGIHLAYELAQRSLIEGGINRVIIATDGDFNVGTVSFEALVNLIEEKREHGVALTALGFGTGNYNDKLLEQLADAGNGNYAYVDNQREARKVLVDEMSSTLQTIAKDVKIQVEFNPAVVAEYRLIGYENRMLRREDFNNDQIDAGEIGAGHTVTALYELTLVGSRAQLNDPLRYGRNARNAAARDQELAFVKLRYKQPDGTRSRLIERPVTRDMLADLDADFGFATAVAAFGQSLRGASFLNGFDLEQIADLAQRTRGRDHHGYRSEFLALIDRARSIGNPVATNAVRDDRLHVSN